VEIDQKVEVGQRESQDFAERV